MPIANDTMAKNVTVLQQFTEGTQMYMDGTYHMQITAVNPVGQLLVMPY